MKKCLPSGHKQLASVDPLGLIKVIATLKAFISAWTPASASASYPAAYFYQTDRNFISVRFSFTAETN